MHYSTFCQGASFWGRRVGISEPLRGKPSWLNPALAMLDSSAWYSSAPSKALQCVQYQQQTDQTMKKKQQQLQRRRRREHQLLLFFFLCFFCCSFFFALLRQLLVPSCSILLMFFFFLVADHCSSFCRSCSCCCFLGIRFSQNQSDNNQTGNVNCQHFILADLVCN